MLNNRVSTAMKKIDSVELILKAKLIDSKLNFLAVTMKVLYLEFLFMPEESFE